jgi:hypothetical protein
VSLNAVANADFALLASAVGTAIHDPVNFDAMADDSAVAVAALRGECVNCTLEAVEDVGLAIHFHFE